MDGVRFLQVLIILVPVVVAIYLLRLSKMLRLEKRLSSFAITSNKDDEVSFFDKVGLYVWKLVCFISKFLKKSAVLRKYAEKYEKFIPYEKRGYRDGSNYVAIKFGCAFIVFILGMVTLIMHYDNFDFMILLVIIILVFFLPDVVLNLRFGKKRKRIEEDLLKAIIIMNNAFSSGKSIIQAIDMVRIELDGPIKDEFEKIYLDISYGLGLDVVFNRFYERVKIEDAKYVTTCLTLLNKTGGDIVSVFRRLEKSILDKKNLRNELNSLTSSSRFVFKFLAVLPFVFAFIIFILNPTYFTPLVSSSIGVIILLFILVLYVLYIWIIRRILEVEI